MTYVKMSIEKQAKIACLYAGAVWGLFWIPLRELEDTGLHGLWITVVYFFVPTFFMSPMAIWRWKYLKVGGFRLQTIAMLITPRSACNSIRFVRKTLNRERIKSGKIKAKPKLLRKNAI